MNDLEREIVDFVERGFSDAETLESVPHIAGADYRRICHLYWQALEDRDRWRRKAQRLAWGLVGLAVLQAAVIALLVVAR